MTPHLARAIDIFHRFLRWWLAELTALVPERARAALGPRSGITVVDASGPEEATVARGSASKLREVARVPNPSRTPGGMARPIPGLSRRALRDEVVLRLPAEAALRKTVSLPLAAESNLREILFFELDRQTPFRPDEVYFDYDVRERLPSARRLVVEITVLARAAVDPLLAWLAPSGLEPARIEGAGGRDGEGGWTCRLPARGGAAGDHHEGTALARALNPGLAVVALVLAGVAVGTPILRQEALLADLQAELAAEKRQAEATLKLRDTLGALSDEALYLVSKKRAEAPFLEIWNEVTRVMPDHSFALELRLRDGQVELIGQSEAATGLLDVIEGSPLFHRASFRSPITRGRGEGEERFHLAFEVQPREVEQQQRAAAEEERR